MSFYKQPFVFIAGFVIMGILFKEYSDIPQLWILCLSLLLLLGYLIFSKSTHLRGILIFGFCFLLGLLINYHSEASPVFSDNKNSTVVLHINEIASTSKEWRKCIAEIVAQVDDEQLNLIESRSNVLLYIHSPTLMKGDDIVWKGEFNRILNKGNPGEFNSVDYWRNKGISLMAFVSEDDYLLIGHRKQSVVSQFFDGLRNYLSTALEKRLSGKNLALAKALILGDKSMLDGETRNSFSNAGGMHVLAVSGLHVGIILYLLKFLFGSMHRIFSKNSAAVTAICLVWIYAGVTGFSPSVMRASFMFSILVLGQLLGKKTSSLNLLFFSAFCLLVYDSRLLYEIGFQLSYLAMLGILICYEPIKRILNLENKLAQKVWEGTSIGIAAQVLTIPLTLYYFHQFPNYFALTNLGIMVLAGIILGVGLLQFTISWWGLAAKYVGLVLSFSLALLLMFVQFVESLPWSVAYGFDLSILSVFGLYAVIVLLLVFRNKRIVVAVIASIACLCAIQVYRVQNILKTEIIVFNHNKPLIAIKDGELIQCFYTEGDKMERAEFVLSDYQKISPGIISWHPITEGKQHRIKLGNHYLNLWKSDEGISFNFNNQKFLIRTAYAKTNSNRKTIDMPYLAPIAPNYNLRSGAITIN